MKKIKILTFDEGDIIDNLIYEFTEVEFCQKIDSNYLEAINFFNERLILAVTVDSIGSNYKVLNFIKNIKKRNICFDNVYAGLIIVSNNELYTKTFAQQIVFLLNNLGIGFIGQPLVEVIEDYKNFETWKKVKPELSLEEIAKEQIKKLFLRLKNFKIPVFKKPRILALHASSYQTSNTLMLWQMAKKYLKGYVIEEIEIEDGNIIDCSGCPFEVCLHYAKQKSCYYGGVIVENILPAMEESDYILWICPNYNDSISAKLMAVINRMTVLYRRISLNKKVLNAVIISGNSGSDSVAKQLISGLNLNKGLILPPYFSIMAIANDSGKILEVEGIEKKAENFANQLMQFGKKE